MTISVDKLIEERTLLQKDFDQLSKKMKQVEIELIQMKANLMISKVSRYHLLSILISMELYLMYLLHF